MWSSSTVTPHVGPRFLPLSPVRTRQNRRGFWSLSPGPFEELDFSGLTWHFCGPLLLGRYHHGYSQLDFTVYRRPLFRIDTFPCVARPAKSTPGPSVDTLDCSTTHSIRDLCAFGLAQRDYRVPGKNIIDVRDTSSALLGHRLVVNYRHETGDEEHLELWVDDIPTRMRALADLRP